MFKSYILESADRKHNKIMFLDLINYVIRCDKIRNIIFM